MKTSSTIRRKPALLVSLLTATVVATACGGGGSSSDNTSVGMSDPFDDELSLTPAQIQQQCDLALAGQPSLLTPGEVAFVCQGQAVNPVDDFVPVQPVDNTGPDVTEPGSMPIVDMLPSDTPSLFTAPSDIQGGQYYINPNNSALLTGPVFGSGTQANASLVKPLNFVVTSSQSGLELIEVRALDSSSRPQLLGIVENFGTETVCAVFLEGQRQITTSGTSIGIGDNLDFAIVDGEVGYSGFGSVSQYTTSSCIAPRSFAYVVSNLFGSFDETAEVRYETLTPTMSEVSILDAAVIPQSYSLGASGIDITIVNQHDAVVDVFLVRAIAIDENGHGFATDIEIVIDTLNPGEEYVVEGLFNNFNGTASTVRVLVDFELDE